MFHFTSPDYETLKANVMSLAVACPVGQDNPVGCPLHEIRLLSLRARLEWVKSRNPDELHKIAAHHCACIQTKEFLQTME